MVTSNKLPDKKVVKMGDHNNSVVVPQRTLIGEVNEHITCPLCRGYYIDATTIVECLHSFCRSCIIKHLKAKSYCPVCEMMINSAKPNIKLDKALQDIVYKLVPGLFQKEMERRQQFYASRPGPAACATPEQRGEDTERIIFSPEDVISFSLEYADATDADSISSKSSDSNEPPSTPASTRRYLQCPAVVNISHLKKFLSMKFDIDSTQFAIDILYKRVPLPDYYTLMDIAYIYNWKRNEPMRFFYQIIDYVAIRNRIFDINRKSSLQENKASPALTEDTNDSSSAPNLNDQVSEASSGTDSPMPDDNSVKSLHESKKKDKSDGKEVADASATEKSKSSTSKKNDDEVEKSQFLNSFELTAKSNCLTKTSPGKGTNESSPSNEPVHKSQNTSKIDEKPDSLKRKHTTPPNTPELKKIKIEIEKAKLCNIQNSSSSASNSGLNTTSQQNKPVETPVKPKTPDTPKVQGSLPNLTAVSTFASSSANTPTSNRDLKPRAVSNITQPSSENVGLKRPVVTAQSSTPKRKHPNDIQSGAPMSTPQKSVSPLKIHLPKMEPHTPVAKQSDTPKASTKKMPDLKPSVPGAQPLSKTPPVSKVRMDLLANNSDPTIDRTKILSQVKTSLSGQSSPSPSGDPLKSLLFDSCKINIPSSLSITLTDQKLDPRNNTEQVTTDSKKAAVNKNVPAASNALTQKVPTPPVHNYIEILKLPDSDAKKSIKPEGDSKVNPQNKTESSSGQPKPTKSSETSEKQAKGPIPNLKPIADTKLGKQAAAHNSSGPITFQQTFEQQLQTLQTDKKSKLPKNKAQVPKLVPATPKAFSAANKPSSLVNKPNTTENKGGAALDLSSPHSVQSPSGALQTFDKAFETMQSIANLAKKQTLSGKGMSPSMSQSSFTNIPNRPLTSGSTPLRIPTSNTINQIKLDKMLPSSSPINSPRPELVNKGNSVKSGNGSSPIASPGYQMSPHASIGSAQPSPRQTRSPSSSPKLVIAEDKQGNAPSEQNINQSNQITSTQLSSTGNAPKSESPSTLPGTSKMGMKPLKPMTPPGKIPIRHQIPQTMKPNQPTMNLTPDYLRPQLMQQALMRQQIEMNAAWLKATQRYEMDRYKMANLSHQNQNDFNNKDKQ